MTKLLEAVVADVRALPADEQDRVAQAVLTLLRGPEDESALA